MIQTLDVPLAVNVRGILNEVREDETAFSCRRCHILFLWRSRATHQSYLPASGSRIDLRRLSGITCIVCSTAGLPSLPSCFRLKLELLLRIL